MRHRPLSLVAALLVAVAAGLVAPASAAVAAPPAPSAEEAKHVPGRVLVRAADAHLPGLRKAHGLGSATPVGATGFHAVSTNGKGAKAVRDALRKDRRVAAVELDYIRSIDATPNDTHYQSQQGELRAVGFPTGWDRVKATNNEVIAVLDTGVDLDHPDLVGRLTAGWDFVTDDATPQDEHGHGTLVAGTAAANTNNGKGGAGASWGAVVMPLRVLDALGDGTDSDVAAAITWAADRNVDVINLSLSGPNASTVLRTAVDYANGKNVVVVAAAGNNGTESPSYPAAYDNVLAVGATDDNGNHAAFSQQGTWLDIAAPGVAIFGPLNGPGELYAFGDGTSFATPIVAGAAALVRAQRPSLTAVQVRDRLKQTATDKGAAGPDKFYGHGLLNVVAATVPPPAPPPPPPSRRSGYWMVDSGGFVYAFGDAGHMGALNGARGNVVDIEPTPSGNGYWLLTAAGEIFTYGDATHKGQPGGLPAGEVVTAMSAHPKGAGYWVFTSWGRVFAFGGAPHKGDMAGVPLNGPVLDSVATPTGNGYYMVGSDGGIFAFGDARFRGSMGGHRLNAPVQSLVPDGDNDGYWLVASDGGIFAFSAPFRGSMGGSRLNRPISGMVRFGDGYLMVGEDGGIFNFSSKPFHGSLGNNPPPRPVVAVAALED